jgi:hypothetical protein
MPNATFTFWSCFDRALSNNKKTYDGKRRVLSIIAEDFTYDELQTNLGVSMNFVIILININPINLIYFVNIGWKTSNFRIT